MKRFAAAILAVLYISTSAGATVHLHYCMGKLADWSLGQKESKTCGNCGMKTNEAKEKGCCNDENKFLKTILTRKRQKQGCNYFKYLQ